MGEIRRREIGRMQAHFVDKTIWTGENLDILRLYRNLSPVNVMKWKPESPYIYIPEKGYDYDKAIDVTLGAGYE